MGRKIPGKKHRGVKDPVLQQEKRIESLKTKINAPPIDPDEQQIPKSLQRIMDLTRKVKDGTIPLKRKRKSKNKKNQLMNELNKSIKRTSKKGTPEKATPVFIQRDGENDRAFLNRVNNIVQSVLVEDEFEKKYGVEVHRNPITGEVKEVIKKPKHEVDVMLTKIRKEAQKKKKKKKKASNEERLTKVQKRKLKVEERKQRKKERRLDDGFSKYKDEVKFGDIVHGPPTLHLPKKALKDDAPRPGKKDLLLKSVLQENKLPKNSAPKKNILHLTKDKRIDRKGKRKDLPAATRRQLELQRDQVVKAYQLLKSKKTS